jgi:hypothetical protein
MFLTGNLEGRRGPNKPSAVGLQRHQVPMTLHRFGYALSTSIKVATDARPRQKPPLHRFLLWAWPLEKPGHGPRMSVPSEAPPCNGWRTQESGRNISRERPRIQNWVLDADAHLDGRQTRCLRVVLGRRMVPIVSKVDASMGSSG